MAPVTLAQAVREFREGFSRPAMGIVRHEVTWDLDPSFVGRPVNAGAVRLISAFVDRKLEEYSRIYNTQAAVHTPEGRATYAEDDHVAHSRRNDSFLRFNTAGLTDNTVRDAVENSVRESRLCGNFVGANYPEGVDFPAVGEADDRPVEPVNATRHPLAVPFEVGDENETEDSTPAALLDPDGSVVGQASIQCTGIRVRRIQESNIEGFSLEGAPPVQRPLAVVPAHPARISVAERVERHQWSDMESQGGACWRTLRQPDLVPSPYAIAPIEGPEEGDECYHITRPGVSEARVSVGSDGNLNTWVALTRPRGTLSRTVSPSNTSYVTTYNLDHATLKISARVLTAPSDLRIEDSLWFDICANDGAERPKTIRDFVRSTVKANMFIDCRRKGWLSRDIRVEEVLALETLREMVTEEDFRRYLKYGFVAVSGRSGDVYQVFRDKSHTKVWRQGKVIEEICIRLTSGWGTPRTDDVVAFVAMIRADEESFKKAGNVYRVSEAA